MIRKTNPSAAQVAAVFSFRALRLDDARRTRSIPYPPAISSPNVENPSCDATPSQISDTGLNTRDVAALGFHQLAPGRCSSMSASTFQEGMPT